MANISNFVFFDYTSTEKVSNYLTNAQNASAVTVQVDAEDAVDLHFEAMNDLTNQNTYFPIQAISLGDFRTYETIEKRGLYMIIFDGIYRIRGVLESGLGECKVNVVAVG